MRGKYRFLRKLRVGTPSEARAPVLSAKIPLGFPFHSTHILAACYPFLTYLLAVYGILWAGNDCEAIRR